MNIYVISNFFTTISNAALIILDIPFCTFLSTSVEKIPGSGIAGSKRMTSILIAYLCTKLQSCLSLRDSVFPQRTCVSRNTLLGLCGSWIRGRKPRSAYEAGDILGKKVAGRFILFGGWEGSLKVRLWNNQELTRQREQKTVWSHLFVLRV